MELSKACVVWLTGLSGAGKTTLCRSLEQELRKRGFKVQVLDGDANAKVGFALIWASARKTDSRISAA